MHILQIPSAGFLSAHELCLIMVNSDWVLFLSLGYDILGSIMGFILGVTWPWPKLGGEEFSGLT
jgi:hypothetical protein